MKTNEALLKSKVVCKSHKTIRSQLADKSSAHNTSVRTTLNRSVYNVNLEKYNQIVRKKDRSLIMNE